MGRIEGEDSGTSDGGKSGDRGIGWLGRGRDNLRTDRDQKMRCGEDQCLRLFDLPVWAGLG